MGIEALSRPVSNLQQLQREPITQMMLLLWESRDDLRQAFDIQSANGQRGLLAWYAATCADRSIPNDHALRSPAHLSTATVAGRGAAPWRPGWYKLVTLAADATGRASTWLPESLRRRGKEIRHRLLVRSALSAGAGGADDSLIAAPEGIGVRSTAGAPGINLIGHARSESGLGQHMRYMASALEAVDLRFCMIDYHVGVPSRRRAQVRRELVSVGNPYRVNVFLMSPSKILDAYCHFGQDFFGLRYNILYAVWELSKWPPAWVGLLELFDEIWVPTRFVGDAIPPDTSARVINMPICVAPPPAAGMDRASLGLPAARFLFLVCLDAFSFIERKNPVAAIRAFKLAFSDSRANVGLVIKVMNADPSSGRWRQLIAEIGDDLRIVVINRVMPFDELLDLYRMTDCYVSLHRSEGVGMCAAEAMWFGKPVIVTNYSGNTDFTLAENSCLVDCKLVAVEADQYPFGAGQFWAEPDIDQAAGYMRKLRSDAAYAADMGARGALAVREALSPRKTGQICVNQLRYQGLV